MPRSCPRALFLVLFLIYLVVAPVSAQALRPKSRFAPNQYILILADAPVAERFRSPAQVRTAMAGAYRQQVQTRQRDLTRELAARNIRVTDSVSILLNALFVTATPDRLDELQRLPGVIGVRSVRRGERHLNKAVSLMNAPAAWNAVGGQSNAGRGIKIAVIDTGIDHTHPAFQDNTLAIPAGFPKCNAVSDCLNFTNNKVIVARSYVPQIAAGSDPNNPAADSSPDDYSARDREGHGTAVASIAAGNANTGSVTINGMAPKAWLGSYKVYGSPNVNDYPPETVWLKTIEDALNDGMDVAVFSSGVTPTSGPLDRGAACGLTGNAPCDALAAAFENAANAGMVIVCSAGNDGQSGWIQYPNFGSISSPAHAPSVLATGATTNSHVMVPTVSLANPNAPANLRNIPAVLGDSYSTLYAGSVATAETAPFIDVAQLGNDGRACAALPRFSLSGAYALIQNGGCTLARKAQYAGDAGATGAIVYVADSSAPFAASGVDQFEGNFLMIANSDGLALKAYMNANPGALITADLAGREQDVAAYSQSLNLSPPLAANQLASYSSQGPATGSYAIKPDLVATGGLDVDLFFRPDWSNEALPVAPGMYLAAQRFDPLGSLFSVNGYAAGDGTSFAAPLAGGAAALVKQARPAYGAAQIRSALVNTAAQDVTVDDFGAPVDTRWLGAGRLDAGAAVASTVSVVPSTLSFGLLKAGAAMPQPAALTITNHGGVPVTLTVTVAPSKPVAGIAVTVDRQSITLAAGASAMLTATLSGTVPTAGSYSGAVMLQGPGVSLRVPYLFLVGSGTPYNIPVIMGAGEGFVGSPLGSWTVAVTDASGVAVENASVGFAILPRGAVTFQSVPGKPQCTSSPANFTCLTDQYGFAWVDIVLGPTPGNSTITVTAASTRIPLGISARQQPTIAAGGVLAAANVDKGTPIAPGSYVPMYGTDLSDYISENRYPTLPMANDYVTVSFDIPSAGISVPGRLTYVSPTQVNVQAPWELQGQTSAQVKVTINQNLYGNVVTVPLNDYAPAFYHAAVDALDESYKVITPANPARRGAVVQLYLNGLGPVTNQPESGSPASSTNLAMTTQLPVVMIGGVQAQVQFSGLAPGFAGLYQVNVTVPSTLTPGAAVPVTVSIGGKTSKEATLPVQ